MVFEVLSVKENLYFSLKMDKGIWILLWYVLSVE